MRCIRHLVAFAALALLFSHATALRDVQAQAEKIPSTHVHRAIRIKCPFFKA